MATMGASLFGEDDGLSDARTRCRFEAKHEETVRCTMRGRVVARRLGALRLPELRGQVIQE
jgi:hypothetical protein